MYHKKRCEAGPKLGALLKVMGIFFGHLNWFLHLETVQNRADSTAFCGCSPLLKSSLGQAKFSCFTLVAGMEGIFSTLKICYWLDLAVGTSLPKAWRDWALFWLSQRCNSAKGIEQMNQHFTFKAAYSSHSQSLMCQELFCYLTLM